MLKDILLSEGNRGGIDNETLERVRTIDTATRKTSPAKHAAEAARNQLAVVEESAESILDVSELSFDETRDDLAESRHALAGGKGPVPSKRRSSGAAVTAGAEKRRRTRSMAAHLDGDQVLSTTTKVTVDKEGNAHAESIIEALPVGELRKKARKSRESRGAAAAAAAAAPASERRVTYNERPEEFSPSAPPMPSDMRWDNGQHHVALPPVTPPMSSPLGVKRNFSNASNIHSRPHVWQKKSVVMGERCGPCGKRIGFSKTCLKCRECFAVCHPDCRHEVSFWATG